jgi:hypothetical protein
VATQSWLGLSSVNPVLLGIGRDSPATKPNGGEAPAPPGKVLGAPDEEGT